ncbi:hypothetical protein Taro_001061, partial [Colocasia esculenta]|nr:hypothetical protein [Colocasia esculenta]
MEVLRPVPKQSLGISLTKGAVPLTDNTTLSTPAGLLLFPGQEGSPLLLQVKKPTSWYKPQCGSARLMMVTGIESTAMRFLPGEATSSETPLNPASAGNAMKQRPQRPRQPPGLTASDEAGQRNPKFNLTQ